jgi:hypothetical protein
VIELGCEVHALARWRALDRARRRATFEHLRDVPAPEPVELEQTELFA